MEAELRQCLVNLERRQSENQKLRIKYADEPNKIVASETELFAVLDQFQAFVIETELYKVLLERESCLKTLLSLLTHENSDISAKVVKILVDLLDYDSEDKPGVLVFEKLLELNLIDLIVLNLERLNQSIKEEATCIFDSLVILESVKEFSTDALKVNSEKLIRWMVKQLKYHPEYNNINLEVSDLLTILVGYSHQNKLYLVREGGIDALLLQVANYRKVEPTGSEHEYLGQIFNCLCSTVFDCDEARESFLEEEGVDLIELILREKGEIVKKSNIKMSTVQLMSYVVSTDKNYDPIVTKCCERFIEVLGLRVIFPIFNNPKLLLNRRLHRSDFRPFITAAEEHTSTIILALLKFTQNEEYTQRILIKFADMNFSKFERALALHDKYFEYYHALNENSDPGALTLSYCNLKTIDYIILLVIFFSHHFETYDPISGETFVNYLRKTLKSKPHLCREIPIEARKHIEQVKDSPEEYNSLVLLVKKFENLCDTLNA